MSYRQEYVYHAGPDVKNLSLLEWSEKLSREDKAEYDIANKKEYDLVKAQVDDGNLVEDFEVVKFEDVGYEAAYSRAWISKEAADAFVDDADWKKFHDRYCKETDQELIIKIRIV